MDLYQTTYSFWSGGPSARTITNDSISHKTAKWYGFRDKEDYDDTFNEENKTTLTLDGKVTLQATHTYVDTIYVHKGSRTILEIPYYALFNDGQSLDVSTNHYQRWFDYRTDGNYHCEYKDNTEGTISDLLTPDNDWYANIASGTMTDSRRAYRFTNGYVQIGKAYDSPDNLWQLGFYYPTDEEFKAMKETQEDDAPFKQPDNDYYVVACDVSNYNDTGEGYLYDGYAFGVDYNGTTQGNTASGKWWEPTLGGRAIFYVVGVDDDETSTMPAGFEAYDRLKDSDYQKGGDKYLEEYEITYPTRRLSNHTQELVALSKDANAYAIPGITADEDTDELTVAFAEEESLFELKSSTISGTSRVIQFYKAGLTDSSAPWTVEDGTTATILVTKTVGETTYNIARFKLTFKDEATPLTQTQVAGLGTYTEDDDYWWKDMTYRSPTVINENYDMLTSLTFTYGEGKDASTVYTSGDKNYYPFPLDWNSSSYAFYDGCQVKGTSSSGDFESGVDNNGYDIQVSFCEYGIVNDYVGYGDTEEGGNAVRPPKNTAKDDEAGDYWLYIDASDRPGTVAELSFEEELCVGSEIIGTAWIKSAGTNANDDASVMLTIMGVTDSIDVETGNVIEIHEPLYRQCSSQIRPTTYLSDQPNEDDSWYGTESGNEGVNGKGSGTNQWFQLYFRFVNKSNVQYDRYTLKIDNYCASTDGGDYYFDEVKLYVLQPKVEAVQVSTVCTSEFERTPIRLEVGYDLLLARMGLSDGEEADTPKWADFIIINEVKYNTFLAEHDASEYEDDTEYDSETALIADAIKESIVAFYWDDNGEEKSTDFPTLHFYSSFAKNRTYDEEEAGSNTATYNNDAEDKDNYFYGMVNGEGENTLCVDCYTDMAAYTPYLIILRPNVDEDTDYTDEEKLMLFAELMQDRGVCTIMTEYYISSPTVLKVNGEVYDPTETYCVGQTVEVSALVQYVDEDGTAHKLDGVYFDWFFGDKADYTAVNENFKDEEGEYKDGVSVQEALLAFRTYYTDADVLSETTTPTTGDFTQACYDIIDYYLNETRTGGLNNTLVLHKTHLELRILTEGIELVVQPIAVMTYDDEGTQIEVCFGYVPMTLQASGSSPQLNVGFSNVDYPNDEFVPCIRLGLEQIAVAKDEASAIRVNLRNAKYVVEEEESDGDDDDGDDSGDDSGEESKPDHLGIASGEGMDMLYLIGSDDPYYEAMFEDDFDEFTYPVGKVAWLYAKQEGTRTGDENEEDDTMGIYFFEENSEEDASEYHKAFKAREGYYYVLYAHFEEKDEEGETIETSCNGTFPLDLKVVPEYLVWTGDSTCNWNNDTHWKRADRSDLHKTAAATEEDPYLTNEENTTDNGFVPMLFTKVVMPRDSEAELYMSGFIEGTVTDEDTGEQSTKLVWEGDENTENHDDVAEYPTSNIMYDLMVYSTEDEQGSLVSMKTEHYRVNLCDELHLEPGAQLLHAEQLIYIKAWTDVELEQGPWTLVATPLNGVVSGDWYTKKATGTETAEYFTDIVFSADSCDRLNPMVYQRNWSNSGNKIVYTDTSKDDKDVPAYASTGWSSVYNDVSVSHQAGEGFSIKASRTISSTMDESDLMFRFPKADASYTYQGATGTPTTTDEMDRTYGQLRISALVDRTDPDKDDDSVYKEDGEERTITVSLTPTDNDYYIIGNPYTAPMSTKKFMAENEDIKGYWTESTYGPVVGTPDGTSWGTADCLIAPYSAFFVTMEESDLTKADGDATVVFTKDMQTFELDETSTGSPVRRQTAFAVRATGEGGTTSASIAYTADATDDFRAGEDAVLMEDAAWKRDGMPLVYTVAGDKAVSVNSLKQLTLIPIGVFADEYDLYTLSFAGVDKLDNPALVDTYEDTETPITEDLTIEVEGPTHGRYYIKVGATTADDVEMEEEVSKLCEVSAYSPVQHTVVVSCDAGLEHVDIYSVGGMLLKNASAGGSLSCTINGVASGIAIVRVKTTEGTAVKKIRVR